MSSTLKKWGRFGFGFSVYMYVCIGHRDIDLKLHVWSPHGKTADTYFFYLSPLIKLRLFEKQGMKFCKCSLSKNIKARNLKLVSADTG